MKPYKLWQDWQTEFLVENYRYLTPQQLSEKVKLPYTKVISKMDKMRLSVLSTIDREETKNFINRLINMGLERKEVADIAEVKLSKVDMFITVKMSNDKHEIEKGRTFKHRTEQYDEIRELKRLELNNFIPQHEQDERWTYSDLSPSEQLMYHFPITEHLIDFKAPIERLKLTA